MSPPRILLGDHDQGFLESLSRPLMREGGGPLVIDLSSGGSEEAQAPARPYHAIVRVVQCHADVEALTRLKKVHRGVPLLVLVPPEDPGLMDGVRNAGADSVLRQEGDLKAMARLLRSALETYLLVGRAGTSDVQAQPETTQIKRMIADRLEIVRSISEQQGSGPSSLAHYPILVVGDDLASNALLRKALEGEGFGPPRVADSVERALAYLAGEGEFADRGRFPYPALVFLEVSLATRSGFEVLQWLRSRPEFRRVIVVANSSSENPEDVRRAYELGANSFVLKPSTAEGFRKLVSAVRLFWVRLNV